MACTFFRRLCHWGPIVVLGFGMSPEVRQMGYGPREAMSTSAEIYGYIGRCRRCYVVLKNLFTLCFPSIIKVITWMTIHCSAMWWPPWQTAGGTINSVGFLFLSGGTLYYFLHSMLEGPGFVPLEWKPVNEEDTKSLQYCAICKGYKAPRSHHCRKCGRCVLKMDHHCPWINCCVGHANHRYFTWFLFFAVLGCFQASVILITSLYHALNRVWYLHYGSGTEPIIYLTLASLLLSLFAIGMAVGVVVAVGMLLYLQVKSIVKNRTTIEDWIMEKAHGRRAENPSLPPFVYPYDLGWKKNWQLVMGSAKCDGIHWPLRDGCGQFDLTLEQMAQKAEKRSRARLYCAARPYSGRWLPARAQPAAALRPPCSDEPRIPLAVGDALLVTRWKKYWLFGEKVTADGERSGVRGWFPRACVLLALDKTKAD